MSLRTRRPSRPRQLVTLATVLGVHVLAVGALLHVRHVAVPEVAQPVAQVVFIDGLRQPEPPRESIAPVLETVRPALPALPVVNLPEAEPAAAPTAITVAAAPPPPVAPPPVAAGEAPVTVERVDFIVPPVVRYPPAAQRARLQGVVLVKVLIGIDGRPAEIAVERSSGHEILDEAARDIVRAARFRPYSTNGVARMAYVRLPIEFSLAVRTARR